MSVGVVYAKQKRRRNKYISTNWGSKSEKKPFVKIQYKLIKDISGDFIPDEKHWVPAISKNGEKTELKLKTSGRDFAFWDRNGLSIPLITGYNGGTSCGPSPSKTLLPNQYYLQFKKDGRTIGMEIISGAEDQLVLDWMEIYAGKTETKIKRSRKSYLGEMSGYQEIELKKCPTKDEVTFIEGGGLGAFSGPVDINPESLLPSNIYTQYSSYNTDIEELQIIDLLTYQKTLNGHAWQCEAGKRYLVLDKLSRRIYRGYSGMYHVNSPKHRYVEIGEDKIDTDDILSHIVILPDKSGDTKANVSEIKKWIRQASPSP